MIYLETAPTRGSPYGRSLRTTLTQAREVKYAYPWFHGHATLQNAEVVLIVWVFRICPSNPSWHASPICNVSGNQKGKRQKSKCFLAIDRTLKHTIVSLKKGEKNTESPLLKGRQPHSNMTANRDCKQLPLAVAKQRAGNSWTTTGQWQSSCLHKSPFSDHFLLSPLPLFIQNLQMNIKCYRNARRPCFAWVTTKLE